MIPIIAVRRGLGLEQKLSPEELKKEEDISRREFHKIMGEMGILGAGILGLFGFEILKQYLQEPAPKVKYTGIPRKVSEVMGNWKMGDYTAAFRIDFDEYCAVTDERGLYGADCKVLGGPGTVDSNTIKSFKEIANLCERIKDKEKITLNGSLGINRKREEVMYEGKKIIILNKATYNNVDFYVIR